MEASKNEVNLPQHLATLFTHKASPPVFIPRAVYINPHSSSDMSLRKESASRVEEAGLLLAMTAEQPTNYVDTHDLFGIAPDTAEPCTDISPNYTTNNEQHDDDEESLGLDGRQLVKEFDKAHGATATKQVNKKNNGPCRGNSFTREEVLIVSKSVMKSSQDKIRGTDKKGDGMWTEVWKVGGALELETTYLV